MYKRGKMYKFENYLLFIWKTEIIQLDERARAPRISRWNFPLNKPPSSFCRSESVKKSFQSHEHTTFLNKHPPKELNKQASHQATAKNEHENFSWTRKKPRTTTACSWLTGSIDLLYILKVRERKHTHKRIPNKYCGKFYKHSLRSLPFERTWMQTNEQHQQHGKRRWILSKTFLYIFQIFFRDDIMDSFFFHPLSNGAPRLIRQVLSEHVAAVSISFAEYELPSDKTPYYNINIIFIAGNRVRGTT